MAKLFRKLRDKNSKTILGNAVKNLLLIRKRLGKEEGAVLDPRQMNDLVSKCFEAATALEGFEVYLSSRSLNDIKAKLDAVELRLGRATEAAQVAPSIEAQSRLKAEFQRYQAVQDLHARLHITILNVNSLLRNVADNLSDRRDIGELAPELAGLEAELDGASVDFRDFAGDSG